MKIWSDEELIREIKTGNVLAFELLVKKYQERLINFVNNIIKDETFSEDVVQETFISVYKTIDRVDLKKKFSSYIFQIAKNTGISYLRRKRMTMPLNEALSSASSEGPEEHFERLEKRDITQKAVGKLENKYKEIIRLYYFHELSYREITKKLRMPLGTVKTNLLRAKSALKEILKNEGI